MNYRGHFTKTSCVDEVLFLKRKKGVSTTFKESDLKSDKTKVKDICEACEVMR